MEPLLPFELALPPRDARQLLQALHAQLKAAILDGRLQAGLRLPATRALARQQGLSRNTVLAAYDLLLGEGYVHARSGAGTFVADLRRSPRKKGVTARDDAASSTAPLDARLQSFWRDLPVPPAPPSPIPAKHDFRLGVPDKAALRFDVWRRLSARALRQLSRAPIVYASGEGQPALREAIAQHVSFTRAVACGPGDVVVTAGAQQAFDLLARILVTPGRTVVAVEEPGYPPTRAAFEAAGARVVPVPVDAEGLCVDRLPPQARVVCVTPSHQFPLGMAMSAARRTALLDFARAQRAAIVEDDYDGEFRFGGRALDALQTLDDSSTVFYVGTFSKSLFPALRLGYVVAPTWARPALVAARQLADWHGNVLTQETLAAFIAEGHLARHVRHMHKVYAARRDRLLCGLRESLADWLVPVEGAAGLHLAALARGNWPVRDLVQRARAQAVGVYPIADYASQPETPAGLVFGYGGIAADDIAHALARLRRLLTAQP